MVATILFTCGRYLYVSKETHQKTKILLEIMKRKREIAIKLDERYTLMIDGLTNFLFTFYQYYLGAYSACNPPTEIVRIKRPQLPMMQQFLEYQIYAQLTPKTFDKTLRVCCDS